ncbi:MAG: amino acid adenylation domain-containing protein [Clostridia bacterium]|nr:amino acid adenylation domain-containing protein [Clostridia bacterium]
MLKGKALHSLFEEQVEKTPERIVVVSGDRERLRYFELNQKANQFARELLSKGLEKGQIVALKMKRSPAFIVAILGIWKAGGVYLPIDISLPAERAKYLIKDACTKFVIEDVDFAEIEKYCTDNIQAPILGDDLACLIYTSGSTGLPAGVLIEHGAVINGIVWCQKHFNYGAEDVFLVKTSISFVDSLREIFSPLISGGKILISGFEGDRDIRKIIAGIEKEKVSYIGFVPTMLTVFIEYIKENKVFSKVISLKAVFVSGEALNLKLVQEFNETLYKINGTVLYNTYGLTEANDITFENCSAGNDLTLVSIGKPVDNVHIYILDDELKALPVGEVGNLWVAGSALLRGYHNNPELNEKKFKALSGTVNGRAFCTGDLARWLPDGRLQHLGRKDRQVKIRGNRVELGEIEYQLLKLDGIEKAVATAITEADNTCNDSCSLAIYFVSGEAWGISEIRKHLLAVLPGFMVPNYFIKMRELPLTPSGKIDVKALPKPNKFERFNQSSRAKRLPPTNELEEKLTAIWEELLGINNIGINEDFLELGGHSLLVIMTTLRIQREFKVEISLFDLFKARTIHEQVQLIVAEQKKRGYPKDKNIALLNQKKAESVFCFPPVGGYGLYFLPFAKGVSQYSVYGFNFIEHENRLQEYTSQIIKRQGEGPYILLGYSAGGNLAFELAKDMERLGLQVGALILIDSLKKQVAVHRSDRERDKVIERLYNDIIFKDFEHFIPNAEIKRFVLEKAKKNLLYMDQLVNEGEISANIHFVQRGTEESKTELSYLQGGDSSCGIASWKKSTRGKLYEYQGYGSHFDMMQGDYVKGNVGIIEKILGSIASSG